MKRGKSLFVWAFLVFISAHCVHADSSVWKVVKGGNQLFIGGTVHFLAKSDYPLPPVFEKAYNQSAIVVFETDLRKMQTPAFQKQLLGKVTYSDGRNLKTVLSETTYQALALHLSNRGIPVNNMIKFKPGMVVSTLTVIEMQRLGLSGTGVDEYFYSRAINDRRATGELESVDEQIAFISEMGTGQEDELIAYTLRDMQKLPELIRSIKEAWRKGDNRKLKEVAITPLKKDFPEVYDELFLKRNNAWIPKIEAMLRTSDVEFILVGAAHLVGDDGLLAQLESRGCGIQKP